MQRDKKRKNLGKILSTLLGRNPDAHGLLPDTHGWISIKTLLQALAESPDLKTVREADLVDICLGSENPPLEMQEGRIRAKERHFASSPELLGELPRILHICIRRKAWPHVSEKGLKASAENPLLFTGDPELALRMGKRKDPKPISLKVHTEKAREVGILFQRHGHCLFSSPEIPPSLLMGPPVTREESKPRPRAAEKLTPATFTPGSFLLRSEGEKAAAKSAKNQKDSWKHNKKRLRRQKGWGEEA
ncbi:RNA 2'-phosphotransferase [Desulfobotulus sp.]|jgi:putative RNA 2'-phosphotransferase|uniref:RNA 2'-phosphotransferase n=1 Tax=Desulfobotulus sp. TaxID=1940337 RepID=UPI002A36502C|nr:RNA 2'-phosphotransferase [Desulfobotulus sp.]MDY0162703.1 RNA 2'-phosphotransferase [Desulfobotulus sp.]